MTGAAAEEAVRQARGGHYQLACGSAFAGAHGGCHCDTGINHPNQVRRHTIPATDAVLIAHHLCGGGRKHLTESGCAPKVESIWLKVGVANVESIHLKKRM